MSKYEEKPCECGNHYIVNRTYWLCDDCNYFRMHQKTRMEVQMEKQKGKPIKVYELKRTPLKRSNKPLKRAPIRITQKAKEKRIEVLKKDREFYFYIFSTRPHECEECRLNGINTPLPDVFEDENGSIVTIGQYSHILTKGAYEEYRHHKLNMNRLCPTHHDVWEFGDRKSMKIYKPNQLIIEKIKQGL